MEYNFREVEKKWQKYWAEKKTFRTELDRGKEKFYVLDMFPYPSGAGLHVGHPLGYIASDIYARYKRLCGFNVLHPMGYDAFGLPAEQYAIQTGQHPAVTTEQNIKRYREQLDKMGFSFDWDREVRTSDPQYYKWTQWIFLKLFNSWYNPETNRAEPITPHPPAPSPKERGSEDKLPPWQKSDWDSFSEKEKSDVLMNYRLAYLSEAIVNWCPALGTVLANDEVKDGVSERGGYPVERKKMKQWSLRITAYSQRLLDDLETIDWSEAIKEQQRNWIGRSEGASMRFELAASSTPHPLTPSPKERGDEPYAYQTANKIVWPHLKEFSKENRKNLTEAENIVWENVRDNKIGFKIRRQHPIDTYIADFVCLEKKLVIEIDGKVHQNQNEYDERRTFYLNQKGFNVIRFWNDEVINNIEGVVAKIKRELSSVRAPSPLEKGTGDEAIEVFTTRPDTIFGATFMTLAPEHELIEKITTAEQREAVMKYVEEAKNRSDRERMTDVKKVTGVFTGAYSINPFTQKEIPIWVADYVLAGYGTGAVMAVPAHDSRDHAFAKYFGLEIKQVITAPDGWDIQKESYNTMDGKCINSDFLNGLPIKEALKKIIAEIENRGLGKGKVNYRLRDAAFGRQRYWGEPIPIYYKDGIPLAVDENDLPVVLPEVDKFLPTEDGEPPLARAKNWKYKGQYDYETTTMPGWAGSSWYYLRYMDVANEKEFASKETINYWRNVDLYIGGSEHATGHLLYVRFWTKFLFDLGLIPEKEPAKKLINQGMIQGQSKFAYRVLNKGIRTQIFISKDLVNAMFENNNHAIKKIQQIVVQNGGQEGTNAQSNLLGVWVTHSIILTRIRVDVSFVDGSEMNVDAFRNWREELSKAVIIRNDKGKFICEDEVEKMSKSKYNVVNPDDIIESQGADALRLYEMFLGPLELSKPWNTNGLSGTSNFIRKLWRLYHVSPSPSERGLGGEAFFVSDEAPNRKELKSLHKIIKKVTEDIERFSFNTSVSNFMICVNELTDLKCNKRPILEPLAVLVSPYAPHIAEELWEKLGHKQTIIYEKWPAYNEEYLTEDSFAYPISINGKTKMNLDLSLALSKEEVESEVLKTEEVKKYLHGQSPKKVIVVPGRIVNIVV